MQRRADQQVRADVDAEELHVEHVRDPRQRQPVRRVDVRERPDDA